MFHRVNPGSIQVIITMIVKKSVSVTPRVARGRWAVGTPTARLESYLRALRRL
jgi:hypothetical protein